MASANSRIPKFPAGRKRTNENLPDVNVDKKPKLSGPESTRAPLPFLKKSSSAGSLHETGRFSVAAPRKAVLSAHRSAAANIRESMPVVGRRATVAPAVVSKPRKVPAWDLKGRLELMEKMNGKLRDEVNVNSQKITALEDDKSKLGVDVAIKSQESQEAQGKISHLEDELRISDEKYCNLLATFQNMENELLHAKNEVKSKCQEISSLQDDKTLLKSEVMSLKTLTNELTANSAGLQSHLDATKMLLSEANKKYELLKLEKENLEIELNEKNAKIMNDETLRRRLHNTIQELKGNIRVFCRIRPPLPQELENKSMSIIKIKDDSKMLDISQSSPVNCDGRGRNRGNYEFSFDAIFGAESTQLDIFEEISQLVQSVLDGFNVCIFAYGQTGSGKTYTMEGPTTMKNLLAHEEPQVGVIPRSVSQIFAAIDSLKANGWSYKIETSFMEIYNERIRDLLDDSISTTSKKCEIKKTADKGSEGVISNVNVETVNSVEDVYILLEKARHHRSVASTNSNEHSSRSHYIFQMRLIGHNEFTKQECDGILNLVDLAGSERVKEAGTIGDRLTEAKNINRSLSNLGNVIMAVSQDSQHIPYRNSKLTHVLMNSLGGNSKTLMFVNINPLEDSFNETVNSLRFATKVNQCNIGTARRKVKQPVF